MPIPEQSVCSSWATLADVCAPCAGYDIDVGLLEDKLLVASEILYNLTFMQWTGLCQDRIRPCAEYGGRRLGPADMPWWSGQEVSATGVAAGPWGVCGCNRDVSCGCNSLSVIRLPRRPVTGIHSVKVDGQILDPIFYRVDDYFRLTYLPGAGDIINGWPCCQRLDLPATEDDTFEVTYLYGSEPPLAGVSAAATLGCQLYIHATGGTGCRLPRRITNVTRQGVTIALIDDLKALREGWTGLEEIDLWIASLHAARASRPAAVYDPERRKGVRRTG